MNHEEAQEAYSRSLDDALEPRLREQLRAHLADCEDCREFCKGLKQALNALREMPGAPPVPPDFLERVAVKIAVTPQVKPSRWRWGVPVLAFASAMLVVLGGYYVGYRNFPAGFPINHGSTPEGQPATPSFESVAAIELPAAALKDIQAAVKDILRIEEALYAVASAKPTLIFRGAGEDSPLERELYRAALKKIELTGEIKEILSDRHARLAAVEALKAAGRVGEGYNGLLALLPKAASLSDTQKKTFNDENWDREAVIKLYASQLSRKLGKAENIIVPELRRELAAASGRKR